MVWNFIKENKLVLHFKSHCLYLLFMPVFGWVMSNFLTTPTITAIAIVFLEYIAAVILLEVWIKSKIYRWFKSEIFCYCIIYFGILIICILTALPFWNTLVYACDRDNPYKQPLQTGTATVVIGMKPNSNSLKQFPSGHLQFIKDQKVLLDMDASVDKIYEQIVDNQRFYKATFELDQTCKAIGNPICNLTKTEFVKISLDTIPAKSNIADGYAIFTFNSSASFTILIPPQTMEDDVIIIQDVQKNLKKGNQL